MGVNAEEAAQILQEELGDYIPVQSPDWEGRVLVGVSLYPPSETADVTLTYFEGEAIVSMAQQPVAVLPPDTEVEVERYRAFARGIRKAAPARIARFGRDTSPRDLIEPQLLRASELQDAAAFAEVIADDEARSRVLSVIGMADFAREHDLPPLEATHALNVWRLQSDEADAALSGARALAASEVPETIPYVLVVLERWADDDVVGFPIWWDLEGRNLHLVLASIVEPLVSGSADPAQRKRVVSLFERGLLSRA